MVFALVGALALLQFDAEDADANRKLRAANPASARKRVIERLDRLGIAMQLTMTITRGVNDAQVGWVAAQGLAHANVCVIALQPVTHSGRYELPPDPLQRMTLSDVVKAVCAQVRPRMTAEELSPIPCSHPNCGWITLFVSRFGLVRNVMRFIDLPAIMNEVAYKTLLSTKELQRVVGAGKRQSLLARIGKRGRQPVGYPPRWPCDDGSQPELLEPDRMSCRGRSWFRRTPSWGVE